MTYSKTIKSLCVAVAALSCFSASAANDHNMVIKGRVGFIDTKAKIKTGSDASPARQHFKNGYLGEIALGYFFNKNLALELSAGAGTFDFRNNRSQKKNLFFVPVTAMAQLHFPIKDTVRPYIGAGYSYKFIENTPTSTQIKNGGSPALQTGVDLFLGDSFGLNFDLKYTLKHNHQITDITGATPSTGRFKNDLSIVNSNCWSFCTFLTL